MRVVGQGVWLAVGLGCGWCDRDESCGSGMVILARVRMVGQGWGGGLPSSPRFCKPPVAPTPLRQIGAFCVASTFLHLVHGLAANIPRLWSPYLRALRYAFHPRLSSAPIDSTFTSSPRCCNPRIAPTPLRQIGAFCVPSPFLHLFHGLGADIPRPWRHYPRALGHAFHPRLCPAPIDPNWQYSRRFCKPPLAPTPLRQIGAFCVASPFLHLVRGLAADIPRPWR